MLFSQILLAKIQMYLSNTPKSAGDSRPNVDTAITATAKRKHTNEHNEISKKEKELGSSIISLGVFTYAHQKEEDKEDVDNRHQRHGQRRRDLFERFHLRQDIPVSVGQ
jgi:hypothetical protein